MSKSWFTYLVGALFLVMPFFCRADDSQNTEARLRDALRKAVTSLRAAQDDLATAQAAKAETDQQLALCKDQVTGLTTDLKNLKDKSEADHQADLAVIEQMKEQSAQLQRVIEDRERKNVVMFQAAMEVLNRYEKFGLGEAIEAKEPFLGLTRVKLENQVQGYEDKFADNRTYPGQPVSPPPKAVDPSTNAQGGTPSTNTPSTNAQGTAQGAESVGLTPTTVKGGKGSGTTVNATAAPVNPVPTGSTAGATTGKTEQDKDKSVTSPR